MIQAMVGTEHQSFAIIGFLTSHQVKGFAQKVRIDQNISDAVLLTRPHSRADIVEFVPISEEAVVIKLRRHLPTIAPIEHISGCPLLMSCGEIVALCSRIAQIGRACKVGFGESEISFVGMLLRITKFEGQSVVDAIFIGGLHEKFRIEVVAAEAHFFMTLGMAKTIAAIVKIFYEPTAIFSSIAHKSISLTGGITTERGIETCRKFLRDGGRH